MRLDAAVRKALDDVIAVLNSDPNRATTNKVPAGLFVPLTDFLNRGVQTSHALRALADAKMLVTEASAVGPITHREIGGQRIRGVIIAARHIAGLAATQGTNGSARDG